MQRSNFSMMQLVMRHTRANRISHKLTVLPQAPIFNVYFVI